MDYQALLDQAAEELAQCCAIATTLPDGTLSRKLWFEYHFYYARCLLFCVRYQEVCVCLCVHKLHVSQRCTCLGHKRYQHTTAAMLAHMQTVIRCHQSSSGSMFGRARVDEYASTNSV
jgi:hypothetical protein